MEDMKTYKGIIAACTEATNKAGNLEPMSLENMKRNNSSFRHSAQPEVAMKFIVEQKRDDKLDNAEGITTFDSHATGKNVLEYLTIKPEGNRILRDGRVVNPKGETIRFNNWKDELLEEGVESIEI
tara:strand:- start:106 stop:483 length:378 start_codon:yes stop_codon:yes gene_type:complete